MRLGLESFLIEPSKLDMTAATPLQGNNPPPFCHSFNYHILNFSTKIEK